jgi:hypothetical protein
MEETTTIFGLTFYEFISVLETVIIVLVITAIITVQFIRLKKYKNLFNKLSDSFELNNNPKTDYDRLVEKIITFRQHSELTKFKAFEKTTGFINSKLKDCNVYIHFTREKLIANRILKEGFKYSDSFYKTTQEIVDNSVDLTYKLQIYRPYGNYLIVICIPKSLFEISKDYIKSNPQFSFIDNIISEFNSNENLEYTITPEFVLGFIDLEKNLIFENESFLKGFSHNKFISKMKDSLK